MSLLISRIVFTGIIIVVTYFALAKVWTKKVDVLALFKSPSEAIPVTEERRDRIVLNPTQIDMSAAEWGRTCIVEVQNTSSEKSAYSVWIKISSRTGALNLHKLEILSETGEQFFIEELGGISTNFDHVKMTAIDSGGRPCIYLLLYRLRPLESRMFKIKTAASVGAGADGLLLSLEAKGFSEHPAPIASQADKVALQIAPPESLQIQAIVFRMSRKP